MTLEEQLSKAVAEKDWQLIEQIRQSLAGRGKKPTKYQQPHKDNNVQPLDPGDIGMATTEKDIESAKKQSERAKQRGRKRQKKARRTYTVQCVSCDKEFESDVQANTFRIRCPDCLKRLVKNHGAK